MTFPRVFTAASRSRISFDGFSPLFTAAKARGIMRLIDSWWGFIQDWISSFVSGRCISWYTACRVMPSSDAIAVTGLRCTIPLAMVARFACFDAAVFWGMNA